MDINTIRKAVIREALRFDSGPSGITQASGQQAVKIHTVLRKARHDWLTSLTKALRTDRHVIQTINTYATDNGKTFALPADLPRLRRWAWKQYNRQTAEVIQHIMRTLSEHNVHYLQTALDEYMSDMADTALLPLFSDFAEDIIALAVSSTKKIVGHGSVAAPPIDVDDDDIVDDQPDPANAQPPPLPPPNSDDDDPRDDDGYDSDLDNDGRDRGGYDRTGFDSTGFDRDGFDRDGFGDDGFDRDGMDVDGFTEDGINDRGESLASMTSWGKWRSKNRAAERRKRSNARAEAGELQHGSTDRDPHRRGAAWLKRMERLRRHRSRNS